MSSEVEELADWLLEKADKAFPWPGELDEVMADDVARAVLSSPWLRARETAWRANAVEAWDSGVTEGIVAAARQAHPRDRGKAMMTIVFTKRPDYNPYADEAEETFMEAFGKLVAENTELRQQIEQTARNFTEGT